MPEHERDPVSVCERWLSRRSLLLHLALVIWVPGCLVAFWWQVHRAFDGNGLSYLYSVEWPAFALAGVWGWWQLVHTDPGTVGRHAQARLAAASAHATGTSSPRAGAAVPSGGTTARVHPADRRDDEDPELAAYNERLARLAAEGPKGWRRR
ncbi:MAG: hypothetical protein M0Z46_10160 [Actinomycetota bacterium]|nr:hypothetical protein [Actinomycetota bacterium]